MEDRLGDAGSIAVRKVNANQYAQGISERALSELRGVDGAVSVWMVRHLSEVRKVAMAVALNRNNPSLSSSTLAYFHKEQLPHGLVLHETPGDTALQGWASRHRDIREINSESRRRLAEVLLRAVRSQQTVRVPKRDLVNDILRAARNGHIDIDALSERVRDHIIRKIARSITLRSSEIADYPPEIQGMVTSRFFAGLDDLQLGCKRPVKP